MEKNSYVPYIRLIFVWEFPGGPVVRTRRFHCHGPGSIPGWGSKILQAMWRGPKINICFKCWGGVTGRESHHLLYNRLPRNPRCTFLLSSGPAATPWWWFSLLAPIAQLPTLHPPSHTPLVSLSSFSLLCPLLFPLPAISPKSETNSLPCLTQRGWRRRWVGAYPCTPTASSPNSFLKQSYFPPIEEFKCQMLK